MRRRQNPRPTNIYWLFDIRPETIAAGWPNGKPFYCGKTVNPPEVRLWSHRQSAVSALKSYGNVGPYVAECGEFIRIETMEIVAPQDDWCEREKRWIWLLRNSFPGCCLNISDGGQGATALTIDAEFRARLCIALK